MNYQGTKVFS